MAAMVGILIILSLIRLLRLGQNLSETDKIIYKISIDLLALGITTVNITILHFFILKLTDLFEWEVASIVQLCYLSIVIIEDNIQASQYQSNQDFGFNILALHLLVIMFNFERFKNMAVLKLATKLKDGQSSPEAIHKEIEKDILETKQKEVSLSKPDFVKEPQKNTNFRNPLEQKVSHALSG
ncbi:hypothetical protein HDV04_001298 [Boothiomyces sp. JEL0838]|nr:hypothetical protein HDV04_001298 [Boothiomyces sp. JEL0838]